MWTWVSEGSFFTEANAMALLRAPSHGQIVVLFGRQLPDADGAPRLVRRTAR
jgi:hypothetical protein